MENNVTVLIVSIIACIYPKHLNVSIQLTPEKMKKTGLSLRFGMHILIIN